MTAVAFRADEIDAACTAFAEDGFVILRGLYTGAEIEALQIEVEDLQRKLVAGRLPEACGTVILDDPDAVIDGEPFAHYVCEITEVSERARVAVMHPVVVDAVQRLLGPGAWLLEDDRFGVVYQDARPGDSSGYSRIGWHSDSQSGPTLDWWPSVAFTIHLDATSPQNGFLRVAPGSHRGGTAAMPLGFEKVAGEIGVYCDRGDVLLHHCDLWHSAARATDDGDGGTRRHIRGGWYGGQKPAEKHGLHDFVKNARR
jgi:hypothetical protein